MAWKVTEHDSLKWGGLWGRSMVGDSAKADRGNSIVARDSGHETNLPKKPVTPTEPVAPVEPVKPTEPVKQEPGKPAGRPNYKSNPPPGRPLLQGRVERTATPPSSPPKRLSMGDKGGGTDARVLMNDKDESGKKTPEKSPISTDEWEKSLTPEEYEEWMEEQKRLYRILEHEVGDPIKPKKRKG